MVLSSAAPALAQTHDFFGNRDRPNTPELRGENQGEARGRVPRGRGTHPAQAGKLREQPTFDIRGQWVGNAKGKIFGAEGSVVVTHQEGEDFRGICEGSNFLGKAKFSINGTIRGGQILGSKEGHTFQGQLYADGSIRGLFRASDGDEFRIVLQRPYPQWGTHYQASPYQDGQYQQAPNQGMPYQGNPYQGMPYQGNSYQGTPYQGNSYPEGQYQGYPYQRMW